MACFIIAGLFEIGFGLIFVFGKDTLWEIRKRSTRSQTIVPQRTEAWERHTTFWGVVNLIVGIFVLLLPMLVRWGQ